jgi:Hemerythrin HHE cation binding domain
MSHDVTADAPGEHLVQELLWVHGMIRRDLEVLGRLAGDVASGTPATDVRATLRALQNQGPLWQLRVNCLRYCHFVHSHHGAESAILFPGLRRANPSLGPTVDRLEADHRTVAVLLDSVEALADDLVREGAEVGPADDSASRTRHRLVAAIAELGAHLIEHLDFEEESISPTLRQLHSWPWL